MDPLILTGVATGFLSKRASLTGHTDHLGFLCLPVARDDAAGYEVRIC